MGRACDAARSNSAGDEAAIAECRDAFLHDAQIAAAEKMGAVVGTRWTETPPRRPDREAKAPTGRTDVDPAPAVAGVYDYEDPAMVRARERFAQRLAVALLLSITPFCAAEAAGGQQKPEAAASAQAQPVTLKPGRYVWNEDVAAASGPVRVVVSVPLQLLFAFRGDAVLGISTVSTGRPGYDTPTGSFTILQKDVDHRSSLYDDAPMPFMQRLTWDGVALHAGQVTGQPESHGCVRLPSGFARKLYAETSLGATVTITDDAPQTVEEAAALLGTGTGAEVAASR